MYFWAAECWAAERGLPIYPVSGQLHENWQHPYPEPLVKFLNMELFGKFPNHTENPHQQQCPDGHLHLPNYHKLHKSPSNHNGYHIINKPSIFEILHKIITPQHHNGRNNTQSQANPSSINAEHERILSVHHHADELEYADYDALDCEDCGRVPEDHLEVYCDYEQKDVEGAGEYVVGEGQQFAVLYVPGQDQH